MAEAVTGFRIIGDMHDRYWKCYMFYDIGSEKLPSGAHLCMPLRHNGHSLSQRKCLEGFLVLQALNLVLSETETVLHFMAESMGIKGESKTLFSPLLREDDLGGENYFKTMNRNSVFFLWLIEVYGTLWGKCIESRNVAEQWIPAEQTRKYKPRWSEKDQKTFDEEVAEYRMEVKARCLKLEKMAKSLQERIDRIKTLKDFVDILPRLDSAGREVSVVAIQDFHWPSPAKALITITLAVALGIVVLLMNISLLRRSLAALKTWAQCSVRRRMEKVPKSKAIYRGSVLGEKHPDWTCWNQLAHSLDEAEKRTFLPVTASPGSESGCWYWYFMAIFIIILVPLQELTFIIRTFHRNENSGPLQEFMRIPWAPIWILQLSLVYVVMLVGYEVHLLVGSVYRLGVWLWAGKGIATGKKAPPGQRSEPRPDSAQEDRGLVSWLMRPARAMQFLIDAEALRSKGQGVDVERVRPSKAFWSKAADRVLIDEMLKQCRNGKKIDNGFKREVWNEITTNFNRIRAREDNLIVGQIKN
ncbi:unnamed protein product [Tuber aestivum]|uniref:Myb/SANT-like domain-containing protein n=1 Tax=Tuber aestivum TaxID=59557 RepID=A0A292Q7G0_9PEZI|nr:unnamed protein product [Tuber aestivum]